MFRIVGLIVLIAVATVAVPAVMVISEPASAQDRPTTPQRGQRGQPASDEQKKEDDFSEEDCRRIPGGNAPLQRLARIEGRMSVRNLELTFFGKPLHQLTAEDFDYLERLMPFCDKTDPKLAKAMLGRLEELVGEARVARQASLDWIQDSIAKLDAMPPDHQAIELVHNLWAEMLNREQEMMPSDLRYMSNHLSEKRQALYEGERPSQKVLVNPFIPENPEEGG
jgi:hypothetical protein